jgi:dihydroflavonol-4-reductase
LVRFYAKVDWFLSVFGTKRQLTHTTAIASYTTDLYVNDKIKTTLDFEFLGIHQCIKEICDL